MVFVIPQIANVGKQNDREKCRKLDSVVGVGPYSQWVVDRFEEVFEQEERFNQIPGNL